MPKHLNGQMRANTDDAGSPLGLLAVAHVGLGIVPRQNSSGGKASLGRITKRGDEYMRTLLIQGAKSAVMSAAKRDDPISKWLQQLVLRIGWQKACVAMANKNARILWAVMTREQGFDAMHVSPKPKGKLKAPKAPAAPTVPPNRKVPEPAAA